MRIAVLSLLFVLSGCSAPKRGINYRIPVAALTKDVELIGCDHESPPKHCKQVKVTYRRGEEIMEAKRETQPETAPVH